jgi:hypothetical protein
MKGPMLSTYIAATKISKARPDTEARCHFDDLTLRYVHQYAITKQARTSKKITTCGMF